MTFTQDELDAYPVIAERDVDHVMIIGLRASSAVQQLFRNAADMAELSLTSVHRSVSTLGGREADIEARFGDPPFILQIEDKIDASFTPGQALGYRQRADAFRTDASNAGAACVLCAPADYLIDAGEHRNHFDGTVSHEQLRDALFEEGPWGRELALIVEHAIRQHRRHGAQAPPDELLRSRLIEFCAAASKVGITPPKVGTRAGDPGIWSKSALRQLTAGDTYLHLDPTTGLVEIHIQALNGALDVTALSDAVTDVSAQSNGTTVQLSRFDSPDPLILRESLAGQAELIAAMWSNARALLDWWESHGAALANSFINSDENRGREEIATHVIQQRAP